MCNAHVALADIRRTVHTTFEAAIDSVSLVEADPFAPTQTGVRLETSDEDRLIRAMAVVAQGARRLV